MVVLIIGFLGVWWKPLSLGLLFLGYPTMGIVAGQFAFLMTFLFINTFFDKWPLVRKVSQLADNKSNIKVSLQPEVETAAE